MLLMIVQAMHSDTITLNDGIFKNIDSAFWIQ